MVSQALPHKMSEPFNYLNVALVVLSHFDTGKGQTQTVAKQLEEHV